MQINILIAAPIMLKNTRVPLSTPSPKLLSHQKKKQISPSTPISITVLINTILTIDLQTILGKSTPGPNPLSIPRKKRRNNAKQRRKRRQNRSGNISPQPLEHLRRKKRENSRHRRAKKLNRCKSTSCIPHIAIGQISRKHGVEFVDGVSD